MAYANVCTPYFEQGDVTFRATAAVTGKRFVAPSADVTGGPGLSTDLANLFRMAHAAAGKPVAGVAKYDVASGDEGGIHGVPGKIVPVVADGAITAGDKIMVGTAGKAKTWVTAASEANEAVGIAMSGAADGADCPVKLY